jgi:hypothetical protein
MSGLYYPCGKVTSHMMEILDGELKVNGAKYGIQSN